MSDLARADFASRISESIIAENRELATRWLVRLSHLVCRRAAASSHGRRLPEPVSRHDLPPGTTPRKLQPHAQSRIAAAIDDAESRGVEVGIAPDLPSITVDAGRIELVFTNLLSNAIKYSDPAKDRRVVEVALGEVTDHRCAFTVTDNGIGIPVDRVSGIFGQFVRAHGDRDKELGVHGMGLGLSIVWESVTAIGGDIAVTSVEGEGTTFTVSLPVERPAFLTAHSNAS